MNIKNVSYAFISMILLPICLILRFFSKNNRCFFYSPLGLKGNIKYLHEFYKRKGEECYFIDPKKLNLKGFLKLNIELSRAKVIFLTHGIGKLPLICFLIPRIQLWHGFPLKKILLNSDVDTKKFKNGLFNYIFKVIYRFRIYISYTYLVTSDSLLGHELIDSFGFNKQKVLLLGSPSQERAEIVKCKKNNSSFRILYLPTWRDGSDRIFDILSEFISEIDDCFCKENRIVMDIKLHPYDMQKNKYKALNNSECITIINDDIEDMIDFYSNYQCLITDYSSACFEFAPVSNKVIFYVPDFQQYINDRGFTVDINLLFNGREVTNIEQLKMALLEVNNDDRYTFDYVNYVGKSNECNELIYEKFH